MRQIYIFAALVFFALFYAGCAGTSIPEEVGIRSDGSIPDPAPPPSSPNCVSSYVGISVDPEHGADPIPRGNRSSLEARAEIRALMTEEERVEILTDIPGYLHAVQYTALWKFPDDVEFWFPEDENVIHFRSAARLGYGDMGVNRKRMDRIREAYIAESQK